MTWWKRFVRLLLLAALLPLAGRLASAQQTVVSNYATLSAAIASSAVITNFLANSVISLTNPGQTFLITNNTTIDGTSNNIVIDGNNAARLFHVSPAAQLVLNNVQLLRGLSTNGGAIFNEGALIINNAIMAGNSATNLNGTNGVNATNGVVSGTDATAGGGAMGGAIYSLGPVSVYYSVFLTNLALAGSGGSGGNGTNANINGYGGNGGNGGAGGAACGGAVMSTGATNVFVATEFISNICVAGFGGSGGVAGAGVVPPAVTNLGQAALGGAAAGGGLCLTGSLFMSNCLFFNNSAVGGASGGQPSFDGIGANGLAGAPAGGGGLYLSNSAPAADIENAIFFGNVCVGGPGGAATGNSTTAGDGGPASGGGIFTGAAAVTIRNCTLATNTLDPGTAGSDFGTNGVSNGLEGSTNGWQIFCASGVVRLADSILSGGTASNAVGVTDAGYNISSDASLTKSTTTTLNSTDPVLDLGLTASGPNLGPTNVAGFGMRTLALLAGSPASGVIPGVPGLSFAATDQRGAPRGTPGSVGAFETDVIAVHNNGPASITSEPTNQTARVGSPAAFSVAAAPNRLDPNPLGYQWQLNGTNLIDNGNIVGSAGTNLTIKAVSDADLGAYQVFVSPSLLDSVASSTNVYLLVKIPPSIKSQPASRLNQPFGAVVTFKVAVGGAPPFSFQWYSNKVALQDTNEFSGSATSNLTINPATFRDAASYTLVVNNFYRSVTSVVARLTVVPDHVRPTVTIKSPAAGARTTNAVISGVALDNAQVTNVYVWITNFFGGRTNVSTNSAMLSTNGTTAKTWTNLTGTLLPGTNILAVQSVDYSSNVSSMVIRKFFYAVPSPFALSIAGKGTAPGSASVAGNTRPINGAELNLGEGYTLVARPGHGYLLTNWTSSTGFTSNAGTLHFIMTTNLSIQASFVPSPFIPVAGVYNGLFFPTNRSLLSEQTAGMVSHLTLGPLGAYTGRFLLDGASYPLSGIFDIFGNSSNYIPRAPARGGPLHVALAVAWTNNQITGVVVSTNEPGWVATNYLEQSAAPLAISGQYTMLLPPSTNAAGEVPPGYGFVLLTNHLGSLILKGALPDGSAFSQSVPIGKFGNVPLFASLYGNAGFVLGWINLANGTPQGESNLIWIKPAARSGLFTNGFTNWLSVQGSTWVADDPLPLSSATLSISNSSLDLTYQVALSNNTVLTQSGPANSLRGALNPKTGALKLIFGDGDGKATAAGYAAFLQDQTNAGGFFVTKTNAGSISLQP